MHACVGFVRERMLACVLVIRVYCWNTHHCKCFHISQTATHFHHGFPSFDIAIDNQRYHYLPFQLKYPSRKPEIDSPLSSIPFRCPGNDMSCWAFMFKFVYIRSAIWCIHPRIARDMFCRFVMFYFTVRNNTLCQELSCVGISIENLVPLNLCIGLRNVILYGLLAYCKLLAMELSLDFWYLHMPSYLLNTYDAFQIIAGILYDFLRISIIAIG